MGTNIDEVMQSDLPLPPSHNVFDNIWQIRKSGYPTEGQVREFLDLGKKGVGLPNKCDRAVQIGNGLLFDDEAQFVHSVLRALSIRLPVYKIVIPRMTVSSTAGEWQKQGTLYYCVSGEFPVDLRLWPKFPMDTTNIVFRGTYGYGGSGPCASAMIETIFAKRQYQIELRDGDYLLGFFGDA